MSEKKRFRIVLVGTDSLRGKEIKNLFDEKKFPLERMDFYDPDVQEEWSKLTQFRGEPRVIHHFDKGTLKDIDLVFLAADKKTNEELARLARKRGFQVIDLSETFNSREDVPVIVVGVNEAILAEKKFPIIANPNPVTIILAHLFHAIHPSYGILKSLSFVLQPVSAFDESGIEELASQTVSLFNSTSFKKKIFKDQIAFNILSHTEKPDRNGFSIREKQISSEIRRVLGDPDFPFSLVLIQAPVFHTYSLMTYLELEKETSIKELEDIFRANRFFQLSPQEGICPISSITVAGKDQIFIGQIKKETFFPQSFWIWTVADNLTIGSALNAFEIANFLYSGPQVEE